MNLQKMEKWLWGEVELAAHEVVAVADFVEKMVQNRTFVDVMSLVPGAAPYWGAVKLGADEVEKLKAFVEQLTAPIIVEAPPTGA